MSDVSMSVAAGALFAVVAGAVTGMFDLRLRPARGSALLGALAGAAISGLAYGAFLIAGVAVSVLTFSSALEAWPALLAVLIGCVAWLVVRALHSVVGEHFGLPERRAASQPRTFDDLIKAQARGGARTMWLGGVAFALLPVLYGIQCIVSQRGEIGTTLWPSEVQGAPAIALGVGWIGVGAFLHFHFFFGLHERLHAFSPRAKSIALIVAGAGLATAGVWSVFARVP